MQDAQAGRFNLVLAESLDRISRDQEDIAGAYKCLTFAGVRMVALSEGDINELHIGLEGTYSSHTRIARTELEHRILHALRTHLMSAVLFKEFCEEYTREINRLRMEASSGLAAKRAELEQVERQIRTMIEAIKDGLYRSSMKAEMDALEDRKEQLLRELEHVEEPPALLHPSIAAEYRKGVDGLLIALEDEQTRLEASDDVRSLVGRIVIT